MESPDFWARELANHRITDDAALIQDLAHLFSENDLRNWSDAAEAEHPNRWKGARNFSRQLLDKIDSIRTS